MTARSEQEAVLYESQLNGYIAKHNGQFLKDNDSFYLLIGSDRIALTYDRDNHQLARLMIDACGVSSLTPGAQSAIQRLQVTALKRASSLSIRQFAAFSPDHTRLYVPVFGGKLLKITTQSIKHVINGENEDNFWVEHPHVPQGAPAFRYKTQSQRAAGLRNFESLLVETQSCRTPAMRWLVAMHEAFFPFARDVCRARFLLVHTGATQQGKTSAAQRFTQLLGLGEVQGDYSVAALANQPDTGLLVMDNKEQKDLNDKLIEFCLFLSTGARRGRSTQDGKARAQASTRPVGVITSIEGAWKPELQIRCVEVAYAINGTSVDRDNIEDEILRRRDEILSSMMPVFQEWLKLKGTMQFWNPCPRPSFERHVNTLAELLCAYARVAEKPEGWAESIIAEWGHQLSQHSTDSEPDDLEFPIKSVLTTCNIDASVRIEDIVLEDKSGKLFITETDPLLAMLRRNFPRDLDLPRNASGFARRLRSARFHGMKFLTDDDQAPLLPQLKRTGTKRPIGFFIANEPDDGSDGR